MSALHQTAVIGLPPEPLQARAHFVFDKHVIEVRCPAGVSVMQKDAALELANNILAACSANTQPTEQ